MPNLERIVEIRRHRVGGAWSNNCSDNGNNKRRFQRGLERHSCSPSGMPALGNAPFVETVPAFAYQAFPNADHHIVAIRTYWAKQEPF
jgi:hypothetical protein